jgi:hypothetical protein
LAALGIISGVALRRLRRPLAGKFAGGAQRERHRITERAANAPSVRSRQNHPRSRATGTEPECKGRGHGIAQDALPGDRQIDSSRVVLRKVETVGFEIADDEYEVRFGPILLGYIKGKQKLIRVRPAKRRRSSPQNCHSADRSETSPT